MPSLLTDLEGTIARMYGQMGVRWPNPWWPTGNPAYDDCAACVSWALWGLNGNQPYQTIVSGIIERSGLPFIAGNQGIRRGDLIGFRWSTDVNYDHMEVALNSPDGAGNFQTIGTNAGPGDNMAVRTRNIGYVHNYARPSYPSNTPSEEGDSMTTVFTTMYRKGDVIAPAIQAIADAQGWTIRLDVELVAMCGDAEIPLFTTATNFSNPDEFASQLARIHNGPVARPVSLTPGTFNTWVPAYVKKSGSAGGVTKTDLDTLSTLLVKSVTSVKTTVTGAKNVIVKAIKDKK